MVPGDESIELPSDQPLVIAAGCVVALWGITLLVSSLPSLVSIGNPTRFLRLGSLGIRVAAALVGLVGATHPTMTGVFVSVGVLVAFTVEFLLGTWTRWRPGKQAYSKLSVNDEDEEEDNIPLDSKDEGNKSSRPSGLAAAVAAEPPPLLLPPAVSPVVHGLAVALSAVYFAFLRGLQLGADIYVLGGFELNVDIACVVGQVALLGGATSVALQDTKGLSVESSALVLLFFAFAAPIGVVTGTMLAATYDERSREVAALHHYADPVRGHGPPVTIDPHFQLQRGAIGLGYQLGAWSTVVGGALLYQTLAAVLPRELRDADAEWTHKYAGQEDSPAHSGLHPLLGGDWSRTDIAYAKAQCGRLGALVLGWSAMAFLHWPAASLSFEN